MKVEKWLQPKKEFGVACFISLRVSFLFTFLQLPALGIVDGIVDCVAAPHCLQFGAVSTICLALW